MCQQDHALTAAVHAQRIIADLHADKERLIIAALAYRKTIRALVQQIKQLTVNE